MKKFIDLAQDSSQKKLIKAGNSLRKEVSFDDIGRFNSVSRDIDKIIDDVQSQLVPELIPLRVQRMQASAFAFFRGTASLMAKDLEQQTSTGIKIIVCGDAHLGNFGFYASPERNLLFDLNDFDEAGYKNWEWDLKRFLVSVFLAGKSNDFKSSKLIDIARGAASSYRTGLKNMFEVDALSRFYRQSDFQSTFDHLDVKEKDLDVFQSIRTKARHRTSEQVVQKYTLTDSNGDLKFNEEPPRRVHIDPDHYQAILDGLKEYLLTVRTDSAVLLSTYKVLDIVRHSVGVGSFGTLCYLVLLEQSDGSHLILQIKEALPTVGEEGRKILYFKDKNNITEGERIIASQKVMQGAFDPFLGYFNINDRSFYVRQFRDMKESIDLTKLNIRQFALYTDICAYLLASAHSQSPYAACIYGYAGDEEEFDQEMVAWAQAYAAQVQIDYTQFMQMTKNFTSQSDKK